MRILPDVNVLLGAHRQDHPLHALSRQVIDGVGRSGFLLCAHTLNGFHRLATLAAAARDGRASPIALVLAAQREWRARPESRMIGDSIDAWNMQASLCERYGIAGNAIFDAHLAALAIVHQAVLISDDQGFARFAELRWKPPQAFAGIA